MTAVSDDVRQMAYRFHPSSLEDLGLVKAVRRLVDDFSARTGIQSSYVHNDPVTALPDEVTICIYRVVQESLSNVARHAQASHVEVEVMCDEEMIDLSIRDNGVGFDLGQSTQTRGTPGVVEYEGACTLGAGHVGGESRHRDTAPISEFISR